MEKNCKRDGDGRFSGARFNGESVPRLPTFPVRWALDDPRGRPYFVFWTSRSGQLAFVLRMAPVDKGAGVTLQAPEGMTRRIAGLLSNPTRSLACQGVSRWTARLRAFSSKPVGSPGPSQIPAR